MDRGAFELREQRRPEKRLGRLGAQQRRADKERLKGIGQKDGVADATEGSASLQKQLIKSATMRAAMMSDNSSGMDARSARRPVTGKEVENRPTSLTVRNSSISTTQMSAMTTPSLRDSLGMPLHWSQRQALSNRVDGDQVT